MLKKILIANRGEIARRIIRTARSMGVATVAVYSDADRAALHVLEADEAVQIGASPASDSYLRIDTVIAAARQTGADAIHPGYGFLAENAEFADACAASGITFIGPSGAAMRKLGGKAAAKIVARAAGVPVVPGYDGDAQDVASLQREAERIGYPVMIKAVAGGGGRGMRLVERASDFAEALDSAQREAQSSFGNAVVLIEKVVQRPRHIEVQVFGDRHGNVVHLFERDCSMQRRNQKVIEEAPAPGMSPALRERMCAAAVELAKAVGYEGAGTVEFLVEGGTLDAGAPWYFIEMNTRLQVEHPVTEEITGLDLVEWQLRVASGERLPLPQEAIVMSGHAVEVRLCAEDPAAGFRPQVGAIAHFEVPEDVAGFRLESGVEVGSVVSPYYDSMIAKLITHGADRAEAIDRMKSVLDGTVLAGLRTNAGFLTALLGDPDMRDGRADTGLIGREIDRLAAARPVGPLVELAALHMLADRRDRMAEAHVTATGCVQSPWMRGDAFQLGGERRQSVQVMADGERVGVDVWWRDGQPLAPVVSGGGEAVTPSRHAHVLGDGERTLAVSDHVHVELTWPTWDASAVDDGHAGDHVRAPINGKVAKVFVEAGEKVEKGARVAVVEAMKMEHVLHAARDGVVSAVAVSEGQQVTQGALVVSLEPEAGT